MKITHVLLPLTVLRGEGIIDAVCDVSELLQVFLLLEGPTDGLHQAGYGLQVLGHLHQDITSLRHWLWELMMVSGEPVEDLL